MQVRQGPRPRLRPIPETPKLGQTVTKQVRDAIMSGIYVPGQKLVVEDLATRLGVSTMPVREALVTLANEGILDVLPRRGFRVTRFSKQDVEDIFLVHSFIAGVLAERAVPLIDERVLERLRHIGRKVDQLAKADDTERTRSQIEFLNYSFHRTINYLVNAPRLHYFLEMASQYVPRHLYSTIPTWTELTVQEHPRIIDALARRDARRVRRLAEEHVLDAARKVVENLEAHGFFTEAAEIRPVAMEPEEDDED